MHPKTIFRVLVRFAGVYFIILGLLGLLPEVAATLADPDAVLGGTPVSYQVRTWTYVLIELAAGLYLFFRGDWIVEAAFGSPEPCCPHCGYALRAGQGRCPECGREAPAAGTDDAGDGGPPGPS